MKFILNRLLIIMCFSLWCCGGSSGSDSGGPKPDGIGTLTLGGSPVENLRYESGSDQGFTNSSGEFNYKGNIDFYIGLVKIGSIQGESKITLFDLNNATYGESSEIPDLNVRELLLVLDSDIKPSNGIKINSSVHSLFLLTSDDFIPDDGPESKVDSEYKLFLLNRDKFRNNEKLNELILDYSSYPTTIEDWEGNLCTNGYYSNHIGMIDEEQLKKTRSYDMAQSFIGRYECNFGGAGYIGNFSVRTDLSYHCKISGKDTGDGQCNGEAISTIYADIDHENKDVEMDMNYQGWFKFCGTATEDGEFISGDFGEDFGCQEPLGTFSCNIVPQ